MNHAKWALISTAGNILSTKCRWTDDGDLVFDIERAGEAYVCFPLLKPYTYHHLGKNKCQVSDGDTVSLHFQPDDWTPDAV